MEKIYGISYLFSETPEVKTVSEEGIIRYNPLLLYCNEKDEVNVIKTKHDFAISYEQMIDKVSLNYPQNSLFAAMRKRSRESQERIISEYICTIIMQELRNSSDDLTFIVSDEFQSDKIIGRLGYLGLPLERLHIMFVSRNIASFMTNYIEHYAIPPQNDLKLLFMEKNRGKVLGPYPEDDIVSMTRTFFCSFSQPELYPIRVNSFSQFMGQIDLNQEKLRIEKIFMNESLTEIYDVSGGTGKEKTRLPKVLINCEERISVEKRK